jgi:photosystem I subunit II
MAHGRHHRSLQGPNLLKLARKEQCLALLTQLRTKFKLNGQFYRVFPNGEVRSLRASGRCL